MRLSLFCRVTLLAGFLAACQITQGPDGSVSFNPVSGGSGGGEGTPSYSVFWDQSDHLKELVAAKQLDKVATLYRKESAHFDKNRDNAAVVTGLRTAADALARSRIPALEGAVKSLEAVTWPVPVADWPAVKQTVAGAQSELKASGDEPLMKEASILKPA